MSTRFPVLARPDAEPVPTSAGRREGRLTEREARALVAVLRLNDRGYAGALEHWLPTHPVAEALRARGLLTDAPVPTLTLAGRAAAEQVDVARLKRRERLAGGRAAGPAAAPPAWDETVFDPATDEDAAP